MAIDQCAKRSDNPMHQSLRQVRGDREEHSATIDQEYASEFTVKRELIKGHGSNNWVQTRAATASGITK